MKKKSFFGSLLSKSQQVYSTSSVNAEGGSTLQSLFDMSETSRQTRTPLDSYSNIPWVRAAVGKISDTVSHHISGNLYLYDKNDSSEHKTPITKHEILDFINKANPVMSKQTAFKVGQMYYELPGIYYWFVQLDRSGSPSMYWPIPPNWCQFNHDSDTYTVKFDDNGADSLTVDPHQVVKFANTDPTQPYAHIGSSATRALSDEIDTDEMASKYLRAFLANNAEPSAIVSFENMTTDQLKQAKADWQNRHLGVEKTSGVRFTNRKIDYQQLQQNLSQLEMIDLRKYQRDMIIQTFGIPPEMLGIITNSNRATIDAAEYIYARTVIEPRISYIVSEIQSQVIDVFWPDSGMVLACRTSVPDDNEKIRQQLEAHKEVVTYDEVRANIGLKPLPDPEVGSRFGSPNGSREDPNARDKPSASGSKSFDENIAEGLYPVNKSAITSADIDTALSSVDWDDIFGSEEVEEALRDAMGKFNKIAEEEIGITNPDPSESVQLGDEATEAYITSTVRSLGDEAFTAGLKSQFRNIMRDAALDGFTARDTVKRLMSAVDGISKKKALVIARTESAKASNFAKNRSFQASGRINYKEWVHNSFGKGSRDYHKAIDGAVVRYNDVFTVTGPDGYMDSAEYPTSFTQPVNNINCRCTMIGLASDPNGEKSKRTKTERLKAVKKQDEQLMKTVKLLKSMFEKKIITAARETGKALEGSRL